MTNRIVMGEVVERMPSGLYKIRFPGEAETTYHEVPACAGQRWTPQTWLPIDVSDPQRMHILATGSSQRKMRYTIVAGGWSTAAANGQRQRWTEDAGPASLADYDATWEGYAIPAFGSLLTGGDFLVGSSTVADAVYSTKTGALVWDATGKDIWWVDSTYVCGVEGANLCKWQLANGALVWSVALTTDPGAATVNLFAVSAASGVIIAGRSDLSTLWAFSTVNGAVVWSLSGADVVPSGARLGDAETAWCYSPAADAVLIRYATEQDAIYAEWPRPEDGFSVVRYGRQLGYHVRAIKAADGTQAWERTLGVTGQAGGNYFDEAVAANVWGGPDFFPGAVVNAEGNLVFCVLSFEDVTYEPYGPFLLPNETRRVYLCTVGETTTAAIAIAEHVDYGPNWSNADLVARMGPRCVAGYNATRDTVILYSQGAVQYTAVQYVEYHEDTGVASELVTFAALPLTVAGRKDGSQVWSTNIPGSTSNEAPQLTAIALCSDGGTGYGGVLLYRLDNFTTNTVRSYARRLNVVDGALDTAKLLLTASGAALGVQLGSGPCIHRGRCYISLSGHTHRF